MLYKTNYFTQIIRLLLAGLLTLLFVGGGCYDEDEDCTHRPIWKDCFSYEPGEGLVEVSVTLNTENPWVVVKLYENDIEDDILILTDTLSVTERNYTLSVGRYSGSALYLEGVKKVLVIDGDKISTDHESYCEGDCWHVDDAELNLEL